MSAIITIGRGSDADRLSSIDGEITQATADTRLTNLTRPTRAVLPVGRIRFAEGVFSEDWIGQQCLMAMGDITGEDVFYGRIQPKLVERTPTYTEVKLYGDIRNRASTFTNPDSQDLNDLAEEIARASAVPYQFADYIADTDVPTGSAAIISPTPVLDTLTHVLFESFWDMGFVVINNAGVRSVQAKSFTRSPSTSNVATYRNPLAWEVLHDPNAFGTACSRLVLHGEQATTTYEADTPAIGQEVADRQIALAFLDADQQDAWAARFLARFSRQQVYIRATFQGFVEVGQLFRANFDSNLPYLGPHHAAGDANDIYQVRQVEYNLIANQSRVLAWQVWDDPGNQAALEPVAMDTPRGLPIEEQTCYLAADTKIKTQLEALPAQTFVENTNADYRPLGASDDPPLPTPETPYIWSLTRQFSLDPHRATAWEYVEVIDELEVGRPAFANRLYEYTEDVGIVEITLPEAAYHGTDPLRYSVSDLPNWLAFNQQTRQVEGAITLEEVRTEPYVWRYKVETVNPQGVSYSDEARVALTAEARDAAVPPPQSIFVRADEIEDTSMVVRFTGADTQADGYSFIEKYRVGYTIQDEDDWQWVYTPTAGRRHVALSDLSPCQPYQVKVQAIATEASQWDDSSYEETVATTTGVCREAMAAPTGLTAAVVRGSLDDPHTPGDQSSDTTITLSWALGTPATVAVTKYLIGLFASPDDVRPTRILGESLGLSVRLDQLLGEGTVNSGGSWVVAVKAQSSQPQAFRDSPWSSRYQVSVLPRDRISVLTSPYPGGIDERQQTSARLAATIDRNLRDRNELRAYSGKMRVQVALTSDTQWRSPIEKDYNVSAFSQFLHAIVRNLTCGNAYKWRIRALAKPLAQQRRELQAIGLETQISSFLFAHGVWRGGSNFQSAACDTGVTVTAVPVATGLTGTPAADGRSATLAWTWNAATSGADGLGGFLIRYWKQSADPATATEIDLEPSARLRVLPNLDPGTEYRWTITSEAKNDRYSDTESGWQRFITPSSTVPVPPTPLGTPLAPRNTPIAGGATVRWSAATDGNSRAIRTYEVRYQVAGADPAAWQVRYTTDLSYRLSGLSPLVRYEWQVRALVLPGSTNRAGAALTDSDRTELDYFTPGPTAGLRGNPNIVGAPSGLSINSFTYNAATASWNAPIGVEATGLGGYKLEYRKRGSPRWTPIRFGRTATRGTIPGLDAQTNYEWQLTSLGGRVGAQFYTDSDPVSGADFRTASIFALAGGQLPPPTGLGTREINYSGLTLFWTAPTGTHAGAILGYKVEYQLRGDAEWTELPGTVRGTTTWLNGLQSSSAYSWRVRAIGGSTYTDSNFVYGSFTTIARTTGARAPSLTIRSVVFTAGHGNQLSDITIAFHTPSSNTGIARKEVRGRILDRNNQTESSRGWELTRSVEATRGNLSIQPPPVEGVRWEFQARSIGAPGWRNSVWSAGVTNDVGEPAAETDRPQTPRPPAPPASPTDRRITLGRVQFTAGDRSFTARWSTPSPSEAIERYDFYYRWSGEPPPARFIRRSLSASTTSVTVGGLRTDDVYDVQIVARAKNNYILNNVRWIDSARGVYTAETLATGEVPVVGAVPLSKVTVTVTPGDGTAALAWTAANPDADLKEYRVFHRPTGGAFPSTGIRVIKTSRAYTLTGLATNGARYDVFVRAVATDDAIDANRRTSQDSDEETFRTTITDTGTAVTPLSRATVTAAWSSTTSRFVVGYTAVTPTAGLDEYIVEARAAGGSWQRLEARAKGATRSGSYTLQAVRAATGSSLLTFEFRVQAAANSGYSGSTSNADSATAPQPSGEETGTGNQLSTPALTATWDQATLRVNMEWVRSTPQAGVYRYAIWGRVDGGQWILVSGNVSATQTRYNISRTRLQRLLSTTDDYIELRILALPNSNYLLSAYGTANVTMSTRLPLSAPSGITFTERRANSILTSFVESTPADQVQEYRYFFLRAGTAASPRTPTQEELQAAHAGRISIQPGNTNNRLTGLEADSTYVFAIIAIAKPAGTHRNSAWAQANFTTLASAVPRMTTPTNLRITSFTTTALYIEFSMEWGASRPANLLASYQIVNGGIGGSTAIVTGATTYTVRLPRPAAGLPALTQRATVRAITTDPTQRQNSLDSNGVNLVVPPQVKLTTPVMTATVAFASDTGLVSFPLSWTAATPTAGVARYELEFKVGSGAWTKAPAGIQSVIGSGTTLDTDPTSLDPTITLPTTDDFSFRITAIGAAGYHDSDVSNEATVRTSLQSAPKPRLIGTWVTSRQFSFTWQPTTDTAYRSMVLEAKPTSGSAWTVLMNNLTGRSFTTPLATVQSQTGSTETSFDFRIKSNPTAGYTASDYSDAITLAEPAPQALSRPTLTGSTSSTPFDQFDISWTASTPAAGVSGYTVQARGAEGSGAWITLAAGRTLTDFSIELLILRASTGATTTRSFTFRVKADAVDSTYTDSTYSNEVTLTITN